MDEKVKELYQRAKKLADDLYEADLWYHENQPLTETAVELSEASYRLDLAVASLRAAAFPT